MSNGLQKFTDEQARFITDAQAEQYKIAYNRGVAAILRKQELNMIHNTVQPTMMGGGSKANAMPLGFTDNVDYQALVTGGKISRSKKAAKWLDFSSKAIDVGLSKAARAKDLAGSGKKSGKISRSKKADKWLGFVGDTLDVGLEKASKAKEIAGSGTKSGKISRTNKAAKWLDFTSNALDVGLSKAAKVKDMAGSGAPRKPSAWILHVKAYAAKHGVSYKDAMSAARATYKK